MQTVYDPAGLSDQIDRAQASLTEGNEFNFWPSLTNNLTNLCLPLSSLGLGIINSFSVRIMSLSGKSGYGASGVVVIKSLCLRTVKSRYPAMLLDGARM